MAMKKTLQQTITPAILVNNFDDFAKQVKKVENLFAYAQIDVMDGVFVPNQSFAEIEKINELDTNLKLELHLMVANPLQELEKWQEIKNIFRIIFHVEAKDNPRAVINYARGKCWQVGIALNPETSLTLVEPYYKLIDIILFMTVHPGRQGATFLPETKEKIKKFTELKKRPLCAVDGGISKGNIAEVKSWGVEIFNIGSALVMAKNTKEAYNNLVTLLKNN